MTVPVEPTVPEPPDALPKKKNNIGPWFWLVLAVVIGIAVFGLIRHQRSSSGSDGTTSDATIADGERACHEFIRARLVSPSSAHFSEEVGYSLDGGQTFTNDGTVDADNVYGAPLRRRYVCKLSTQEGHWHLDSLTGLE